MEITENSLKYAIDYFRSSLNDLFDHPEIEQALQITFLFYFKLTRVDLTLKRDNQLSQEDFDKVTKVVSELKKNKPLAQIIGEWEFFGIKLKVNKHTLIPRPETEELVQLIIEENKESNTTSFLDIGTGTGCIALALKREIQNATVYAYDVSEDALKIASFNANQNNLNIIFNKVDILSKEVQNIKARFDVIVSNPPYITEKEKILMHSNVLDFEPHLALFVKNEEPLLFYNAIADFALTHLNDNGKLYFEINENYGNELKHLLLDKNFKNINIVKDINEKERIVSCNI